MRIARQETVKFHFTLVAEPRLGANEHPKFEDDVARSMKFVEWVTDVRLWESELKDETKPRLRPRLYRRGLLWTAEADHQDTAWSGRPSKLQRRIRRRWTTASM